jgi:uncharacterized protein (TIGR00296 family)
VGFAEPVLPLAQAIQASAVAAALEDSRFPPVEPLELELIVVEVSLLTRPREVKRRPAEDLPCAIHVGRHGLVVREGKRRGLLLPQVPVDCGWDATEFLSQTCVKAGLSPDAWKSPGPAVFTFEARVFVEERPRGAVVRHVANGAAAAQRKRGAKESL